MCGFTGADSFNEVPSLHMTGSDQFTQVRVTAFRSSGRRKAPARRAGRQGSSGQGGLEPLLVQMVSDIISRPIYLMFFKQTNKQKKCFEKIMFCVKKKKKIAANLTLTLGGLYFAM